MVLVAPSASVAIADISANASCVRRDMRRSRRARMITGMMMEGATTTTATARYGLVRNIMVTAPAMVTSPRRVMERLEPMAPRMVATSPLRREVNSPTRWVS